MCVSQAYATGELIKKIDKSRVTVHKYNSSLISGSTGKFLPMHALMENWILLMG